jgi:hypothetical protein
MQLTTEIDELKFFNEELRNENLKLNENNATSRYLIKRIQSAQNLM